MRHLRAVVAVACLITWLGCPSGVGSQDARPAPPPSPGAPTLEEFLKAARPDNPGISDADLKAYWARTYGGGEKTQAATEAEVAALLQEALTAYEQRDYATALERFRVVAAAAPEAPALREFLAVVGPLNPTLPDTELKRMYHVRFGAIAPDLRPIAQLYLGRMYAKGQGVPQDDAAGSDWYRKAADGGFIEGGLDEARGEFNLGIWYETGVNMPMDMGRATFWFRRAAEHGDPEAQYFLGLKYLSGTAGVPKDDRQAMFWLRKAAEQGHRDAQRELGALLRALDEDNQAQARVVAQCTETVRQESPVRQYGGQSNFNAYVSRGTVHYFGTSAEQFNFEKCLTEHGQVLTR